jgi:UDP-N-acetylmuramoyl-L-alanyl-D-glutamate--2,6-diaminopimelate ligase
MKLGALIAGAAAVRVAGETDIEITGLSYDSRSAKPGDLFFSTARDERQNRANVDDAYRRGARAAVVRGWDGEAARSAFTLIKCDRPRVAMGLAASRFFDAPSRRVDLIGVTGTSGKTTTTYLLASIFEAAGIPCGIIGTIGIYAGGRKLYSGLTTPESIDFEGALAAMERESVRVTNSVSAPASLPISAATISITTAPSKITLPPS